jgi:hypothetical protein
MRLGRSLLLAGQVDQARDCFEAAAGEAARADDGVALAASALAAGDAVAEVMANHRLVALLDLALRHPGVPPGSRARLTARRAIAIYWQPGGQDESRRASSQAVALAEQAGEVEALGAALITGQFTLRGPGFLEDRLRPARRCSASLPAWPTRTCYSARISGWSRTGSRSARSQKWLPTSSR